MLSIMVLVKEMIFQVDDGYMLGECFVCYKFKYLELKWLVLQYWEGQVVEFEWFYKLLGNCDLYIDMFFFLVENYNGQVIVLIYGGGWCVGNKFYFYLFVNKLVQFGYIVFILEYCMLIEV